MIKCIFEDGGEADLRHVTVGVLLINNGKILLAKRNNKLLEGGKWDLMGGFVGRDETLVQAAQRETLEESGYEARNLQLLIIRDNPDRPAEDRQNISFVYVAEVGEQISKPDWEVTELQWFALDKLPPKEQVAFDHFEDIQLYLEKMAKNSY